MKKLSLIILGTAVCVTLMNPMGICGDKKFGSGISSVIEKVRQSIEKQIENDLYEAAKTGNYDKVGKILIAIIPISNFDKNGINPINRAMGIAIENGNFNIASRIFDLGFVNVGIINTALTKWSKKMRLWTRKQKKLNTQLENKNNEGKKALEENDPDAFAKININVNILIEQIDKGLEKYKLLEDGGHEEFSKRLGSYMLKIYVKKKKQSKKSYPKN